MTSSIFIHAAIIGRYKERLYQYLALINKSKLYNAVENIFICYVGNETLTFDFKDYDTSNKIKFIQVSSKLDDFELPTQQYIYNYCKTHSNYNILYLHTKGIHGEINNCIEDWVHYMAHFCINNWEDSFERLKNYLTVGVDLRDYPTLHYSGNFWWSTAKHILSLPEPNDFADLNKYPNPLNSPRHNQEFWICYDKENNKHYSAWESNINCFERHLHLYPLYRYI